MFERIFCVKACEGFWRLIDRESLADMDVVCSVLRKPVSWLYEVE
jgi:hypothetical protein